MDEIIYETKYWIIKLNSSDQHNLGRSVIVLKRECQNLGETTKDEILNLHGVIRNMENATKRAFGATMFNWTCLMNDAYKKMRFGEEKDAPQVHLHFRPRYLKKVKFAGRVFNDTDFARHYKRKTNEPVSEKACKQIIEKIRKELK